MLGGHLTCLADYHEPGQDGPPVHLVTAYVPIADLPAFARAVAVHLTEIAPDQPVVVDVESWRDEPLLPDEDMAAELARLLSGTYFGRDLRRLIVTVTSAAQGAERAAEYQRTQTFTFSQTPAGFAEDPLLRNMHPMIAERLDLWRLSNFSLRRLPSGAEDVYLFHAVARANRKDERLIAIAEVRDLTAARDSAGEIIGYPMLEGILTQAFADIRGALRGQPQRQRPLRNRVLLYVRPVWDIPTATWRSLAHQLASQAADLGLEKVAVRIRMPDEATGEPRTAILDVENVADRAVTVRVREPSDQPIQPHTEYQQRALRAKRLGVPYPYELIRMLTPPQGAPSDFPAGDFTEYDLSAGRSRGRQRPAPMSSCRSAGRTAATPPGSSPASSPAIRPWCRRGCAGWRSSATRPRDSAAWRSRSAAGFSRRWPSLGGCGCPSNGSRCRLAPRSRGTAGPRTWTGSPRYCAAWSSSPSPAVRSTSSSPGSTSVPSRTGTPKRRCSCTPAASSS